jgi:glucosamine--fructose-6-phosphate aminotransferase (isomerizing)
LGLAVTSRTDNLLCEYAGNSLITREGPEISFPKTKSVLACAGILMRLALAFGNKHSTYGQAIVKELYEMPQIIGENIKILEPFFQSLTAEYAKCSLLNVVGTGSNHGLALDAAVKVQEASFIPTRGDSTAGLLHGPVGAFNPRWLVMALITPHDLDVSAELLKQVREFRASSIAVHDPSISLQGMCDHAVALSRSVSLYLAALAFMPAVQLLAYYWTVAQGMNPDKPASMDSLMGSMLPPGRQEAEYKES